MDNAAINYSWIIYALCIPVGIVYIIAITFYIFLYVKRFDLIEICG